MTRYDACAIHVFFVDAIGFKDGFGYHPTNSHS